jgi:hypothetical protein
VRESSECVSALVAEDDGFAALRRDCEEVEALDEDARRERVARIVWQATERALADDKVTVLNACLRDLGLLERPWDDEPEPEAAAPDAMAAFLAALTPEQRAEYDALDLPPAERPPLPAAWPAAGPRGGSVVLPFAARAGAPEHRPGGGGPRDGPS